MADTRLPFKGILAFDRNSQDYVPFRTATDAMLASLMLAYRLASPILTVVLALVRHPDFNPGEITLSRAEDVWARVAEHEASVAMVRNGRNDAFPFAFPRFVLDEVLDVLDEERRTSLLMKSEAVDPYLGRVETSKLDADLRSASLVCKEWRRPAQRTLGRILALQDVREVHLFSAINGPLFGHWTRDVVVLRHNPKLDEMGRAIACERGDGVWLLIMRLLSRMPNVRTVSISTDWFEWPLRNVTEGLERMPALRELRLVQLGDISQLLGVYSGMGSAYADFVPPSELDESPGLAFQKLSLKIGSTSDLSLQYIKWLTMPREGDNSFMLKSLLLDLSCCYGNERGCVDVLEPCFRTLEELWINASGLGKGLLTRIFDNCLSLRRLTIVFRHTFEKSMFDHLPHSLEDICVDFSFEIPDWDQWDQRAFLFITSRLHSLKRLRLRLVCAGLTDCRDKYLSSKALCKELGIDAVFEVNRRESDPWQYI
ncbi:hypothetical protein EW145_g1396 [Phellinidium pouzarii]|uniref:Uncharacterized protein n=1 Tax=Phellinidium pouzarii TaxID=167371 RepID=A0A4S4LGK3_9AGAM|nr:hypothetical protein EW145_g1396 [Phellinidium pouzarii]